MNKSINKKMNKSINKNINKLKKSQNRLIRFYKMSKNFAKY